MDLGSSVGSQSRPREGTPWVSGRAPAPGLPPSFAEAQRVALERIAGGAPLEEVLDSIIRAIEDHAPGMRGSVLLLPDGRRLRHGAAPSLPAGYVERIDGLEIGPSTGSCGTAMWDDRRVVVTDIASDPLWADYREIALGFGLRACWSTPLHARSGAVVGSFAMYYDQPRAPTERDLALADAASHLCSLAVESALASEQLRRRAAQQAGIARLGQLGLAGADDQQLMDDLVQCVVETVTGARAALYERRGDDGLRLRAAAGWPDGAPAEPNGATGVAVAGEDGGWGVLAVEETGGQACSPDEQAFLDAAVNVFASALARTRSEEQVRHQALHDALTGLPNRALLGGLLEHALERAARSGAAVAVMLLDLDDFKVINDSLGHAAGDELLAALGPRVRAVLRQSDTVARFGGDEFVIVLEDVQDDLESVRLTERVLGAFAEPFTIAGGEHVVTASVGVAIARDASTDAAALLRDADAAMYRAKEQGGNAFQFFDAAMRERVLRRLRLAAALREAIPHALELHYQPVVELADGRVAGDEALLRWDAPAFPGIGPSEFVPAAEECGLIVPLGAWVLDRACAEAAASPQARVVSVNVSPRQLGVPGFAAVVEQTLERHGLPPERLALELTEGVLMDEDSGNRATVRALRDLGVLLVLDDFGTGFSSLRYLLELPIHILKIDRSFVAELPRGRRARAIVGAVATMAGALDKRVVAEGIETPEQLAAVRELGCHYGQGYLLGRPAPRA